MSSLKGGQQILNDKLPCWVLIAFCSGFNALEGNHKFSLSSSLGSKGRVSKLWVFPRLIVNLLNWDTLGYRYVVIFLTIWNSEFDATQHVQMNATAGPTQGLTTLAPAPTSSPDWASVRPVEGLPRAHGEKPTGCVSHKPQLYLQPELHSKPHRCWC